LPTFKPTLKEKLFKANVVLGIAQFHAQNTRWLEAKPCVITVFMRQVVTDDEWLS
jgi:hypothetical protein